MSSYRTSCSVRKAGGESTGATGLEPANDTSSRYGCRSAACLLGGVECDRDCLVARELPSLREGLLERELVELCPKLGQRLTVVLRDPRKPATDLFAQLLVGGEEQCGDLRPAAHRQRVGEAAEALDDQVRHVEVAFDA